MDTKTNRFGEGDVTPDMLRSLSFAKWKIANYDPSIAIILHGPAGIGKTAMLHELAQEKNLAIKEKLLSQEEAIDLKGYPIKESGSKYAEWVPYKEWVPDVETEGDKGILFLDEMNHASKDMLRAAYKLIHERKIGNVVMPPGWRIVCAVNDIQHMGGVSDIIEEMPAPLKNRAAHIYVDPPKSMSTVADMVAWMNRHGVHHSITGYLTWCAKNGNYGAIHYMSDEKTEDLPEKSDAFPTPRAWEFFSKNLQMPSVGLIDSHGNINMSKKTLLVSICEDTVGEGNARDFVGYLSVFDKLPDAHMLLLKGPKEGMVNGKGEPVTMPQEGHPDQLYALTSALVYKLKSSYNNPDFLKECKSETNPVNNFLSVLKEMPREAAVYCLKMAIHLNDQKLKTSIMQSPNFKPFAQEVVWILNM